MLERHHEMADRHQGRAEDHGAALAEHPVGQQPSGNRCEIDEAGVEAVDVRDEGLQRQRAEHVFQHALETGEPGDAFGVARQQQIFDHVEDEQRAHPVIGKALPHLGREQERQRPGVPEQVAAPCRSTGGCREGHAVRFVAPATVAQCGRGHGDKAICERL